MEDVTLTSSDIPSSAIESPTPSTKASGSSPKALSTSSLTYVPPAISTSSEPEFVSRCALVVAQAAIKDPFTLITTVEKHRLRASEITIDHLYTNNMVRLNEKVGAGAILVESGDFAAVACWEPPCVTGALPDDPKGKGIDDDRPIYRSFLIDIAKHKSSVLPKGTPHWKLSLMARNPQRKDKGAVRAVIEPFLARARSEGLPVCLEAGNPRARDVYAYFGFKEIGCVRNGAGIYDETGKKVDEGAGVPTWVMVYNWPVGTV